MADEIGNLPRGPARVLKAAVWSWQGLCAAWKHESSFRLEVYLFVVLAPLALWLGATPVERALLIGSLLLIVIVELLNTGIEAAIDRIGPDWHPLSKRAKDMGSAAVLLALLLCTAVWCAALYHRFLS